MLPPSIKNPSIIGRIGSALWQSWEWIILVCFALLCLRFIAAATREALTLISPTLLITIGCCSLAFWRPASVLLAFTAMTPLVGGLNQTALLPGPDSLSLIFSALWLGSTSRRLLNREPIASQAPSALVFFLNSLASIVIISLLSQCLQHFSQLDFKRAMLEQSTQSFPSPYYYSTSAFIWLQGIFFFKNILSILTLNNQIKKDTLSTSPAPESVHALINRIFYTHALLIFLFLIIQYKFKVPEGWADAGYQSPYEDISSFGSATSAIFILFLSTRSKSTKLSFIITISSCLICGIMVIASWSRAAWLAAIIGILTLAILKIKRKFISTLTIASLGLFLALVSSLKYSFWQDNVYLLRFSRLISIENPSKKDPARMNLYRKAFKMIADHPLAGKGIGAFYLNSVNYALPHDPLGSNPDFAHNFILQITAELGLPIGLLFAVLCGGTLWRGLSTWLKARGAQGPPSPHALLVLGVTLSLGAYLQTQMTANSLNVYISNQFFFWFMMAALLSLTAANEKPPQVNDERAGSA